MAMTKPRIVGIHRMLATLDGPEIRTRSPCHHGLVRIPAEQAAAGSVERCPQCSALWDVEFVSVIGNGQELTAIWSA
ncbi:MAG: hypothetical protein ACRDZ4_14770 [Egibacteraceae bacterium]